MTTNNNATVILKANRAEKLLNEYEAIVARQFSELGDFHGAIARLEELAAIFYSLDDKSMALKLEIEAGNIRIWFEALVQDAQQ